MFLSVSEADPTDKKLTEINEYVRKRVSSSKELVLTIIHVLWFKSIIKL